MRRFILVDHSITGLVGHHYEYAMHVLRAVVRAGYKPILVTNRRFRPGSELAWTVLPVFKFGFWPEYSPSLFLRFALKAHGLLSRGLFWLRFQFRYSGLGVAWACRSEWHKYLKPGRGQVQPWLFRFAAVAAIGVLYALYLVCAAVVIPPFALAGFVVWIAFSVARFFVAGLRAVAGEKPPLQKAWQSFFAEFASPFAMLSQLREKVGKRAFQALPRLVSPRFRVTRQARAFGRDAGSLLDRLQPAAGDIIFFPTISENDLDGLVEYLNEHPRGLDATWHFLFRRNIYSGGSHDYSAQDTGLHNLRLVFEQVERSVLYSRSFFYTDTDELTEQYDRLGQFSFHTLPVPHTYEPADLLRRAGPLRLTYLGDARTEKGFALLPELADWLEDEYLATGKARLIVQCNYNIPGGEPKVAVARRQLESLPARYIELYKMPLTSEEYRSLLLASDITLLCYDPLNYYARSSGILVESLALGIPVIVPSGCWLARQFLERYVEEVESLSGRMKVLKTAGLEDTGWREEGRVIEPSPLRIRHGTKTSVFLPVPSGATHVLLRGRFAVGAQSAVAEVCEVNWEDESLREARAFRMEGCGHERRAAVCAPLLPDVYKLWIGLSTIHESERAWLSALQVEFLQAPEGEAFPIGAVGMTYNSVSEIPQLLRDLIDHYPHYRRTAVEFSAQWRSYHNADRLVHELETVGGLTAPRVQQGNIAVNMNAAVV